MTNPDPAQRLAEALRAQASLPGQPASRPSVSPVPPAARRQALQRQIGIALGIALAAGLVLGVLLGLVSLWFPGALPAVG